MNETQCTHVRTVRSSIFKGTSLIRRRNPPLGPPYVPMHNPTVGSQGGAFIMSEILLYLVVPGTVNDPSSGAQR